jgi:enoyl-CoA hydratase/carnithine racemase
MAGELNGAFLRAEADDTVRVVILGGLGPMFSSGHGYPLGLEEDGLPGWRTAPPIVSAVKDQVRAER